MINRFRLTLSVLIMIVSVVNVSGRGVGLVLSGGGAKGIAHVGVIKALEDNDIPIDYVAGTSMGAIVGSLYSCGWSPEKMMGLFTSQDFLDWSAGTIDPNNLYYYYQQPPTPKWVSVNISFKKKELSISDQIIPTSLVNPIPMNIEFLRLYGPYSEQCGENFNNLFVPFRCVASNVYEKHKVVFSKGPLGDAVRASMSFPLVYRPIKIDGTLLYDGGIYDNFPVNVMEKDFNPDFIIGVSVSQSDKKPQAGDIYSQLEDMIIQNNDYSVPSDRGIKIQVPVLNFGVLSFGDAKTIYDIGYETGLSMVDSIKKRTPERRPLEEVEKRRESFAASTPKLDFDSVEINGLKGSPARYLKYLFTNDNPPPYSISQVTESYYRAVADGSLNNLLPQARFGSHGHNTLVLEAFPKRPWNFSVGGFLSSSTSSMIYFSGGYHTMGLNSLDVSLGAWLGQSYYAAKVDARFAMRTKIPSFVYIMSVVSRQKYYEKEQFFFKTSTPRFLTTDNIFLRVGYEWAIGRRMKGFTSLSFGNIIDRYYPFQDKIEISDRDKTEYLMGVWHAGVEANSFDNNMYPSAGLKWRVNANLSLQRSRYCPGEDKLLGGGWKSRPVASLEALWSQYFKVGRNWSFGGYASAYATVQHLNQNFMNVLINAPAFAPTPSTQNYFNIGFRSDNYLATGFIPIWKPWSRMQLRGDFYMFVPVRNLVDNGRMNVAEYRGWFHPLRFLGEMAVIYNFPFASVSAYVNYLSYPAHNWNFGISFGMYFKAPKMLRE